jgi:hypothetical protein
MAAPSRTARVVMTATFGGSSNGQLSGTVGMAILRVSRYRNFEPSAF